VIIIIADVDEVAALLDMDEARQPEIVRPQTSGPCVHLDQIATDDPEEVQALGVACRHPAGECPHMDNPEITCPIHDACEAMYCVMRARDECEAEQEEQVSSLCGYYDERSEHADNIDPCTHPDACKTGCPYLDDDGIYCPQKDGWSAASKQAEEDLAWAWGDDLPEFVSLAQDPEGRGHDRGADVATEGPVYAPAEPEFVEPEPDEDHAYAIQLPTPAKRKNAWTEDENWTVARADTRAEAIEAYRAAYPDSTRTDKAILSRWEKLHRDCREPLAPDFAGDTVPVTQCDEAAIRRPRFKTGDRVRISHPAFKGYTGTIRRYYAATANYLTHIDGTTDTTWLSEEYLEAA